jgi:hypothetical protein
MFEHRLNKNKPLFDHFAFYARCEWSENGFSGSPKNQE